MSHRALAPDPICRALDPKRYGPMRAVFRGTTRRSRNRMPAASSLRVVPGGARHPLALASRAPAPGGLRLLAADDYAPEPPSAA